MTIRDWKEISIWASITVLLVVGVLGSRMATSQNDNSKPQAPAVTINGCDLTATVERGKDPDKLSLKLHIVNPTSEQKKLDLKLNLVQEQFVGSPFSRVATPSDTRWTTLGTSRLSRTIRASGTCDATVVISISKPPADRMETSTSPLTPGEGARPSSSSTGALARGPEEMVRMSTYVITVGEGKDAKQLLRFPSSLLGNAR